MYTTKIKELRERIGLTKTEVGKILGIDRSQYGHYENDDFTIPIKHIITLCDYYNVSLDYIFEFNDTKKYPHSKPEIDKKLMGLRLKEFRKENKLTQTDLAEFLNTTFSTISSYERGINILSTNYLYIISKKYHLSADYLLGKIDYPKYLKNND